MTKQPDIQAIHRLTPLQEGILFHFLGDPESGVYIEQFACRAPARIDREGWEAAWNQVVAAYPALRSAVAWEGLEHPLLVTRPEARLTVTEVDAPGDEAAFSHRLERLRAEQAAQGFDLRQPPLLRQFLLQRDDTSVVFWCYHHLILDGWSAFVLLGEVLAAYQAALDGTVWTPRQAAGHGDYLAWLRAQDVEAAQAYWRARLAGFSVATPLGLVERHDGEAVTEQGATVTVELGADLATAVRDAARAARVTAGTVLQAGWACTLGRYSSETDVVFGVTVSGRPPELPGTEAMVGMFINTVPSRVCLDASQTVRALLADLQRAGLEQRAHEHAALSQIAQWSEVPRGQPLFDSMLAIESFPTHAQVSLDDVTVWQQTNFPLAIVIDPVNAFRVKALFDPRRYAPETVQRLLTQLGVALHFLTSRLDAPLAELNLQDEASRARQAAWNHRPPVGDAAVSLTDLFLAKVAARGGAVAVVVDEGAIDYANLERLSRRYALRLRAAGVRTGQTVAFAFDPGIEMVAALIGITRLGCAYAPLDPYLPPDRLADMVADLGLTHVVGTPAAVQALARPGVTVLMPEADAGEELAPLEAVRPAFRHLLYVIHTSGSTGKPKAAGVYHDSFVRLIQWWNQELALTPADRCLLINKITFDLAQKCVWGALTSGGTLHLAPTRHFDPVAARDQVRSEGITWINCTPSMAYAMVEAGEETVSTLATLRLLLLGGEPVDKRRLADWLLAPGCRTTLINTYGPTECTDLCTTHRFERSELEDLARPVTVGRVLPGLAVHVVDRDGNTLPCGVTGEVVISGGSVGCGYLNQAAMSARQFQPDPEASGQRRYYTGDRGYFNEDGTLIVRGRTDFQVKLRGYRIELEAIAHALRDHADVRDACAVLSPDGQQLVAYVVPEAEAEAEQARQRLRAHLASRLPDYMVPLHYLVLSALPLNANGKLDRSALPPLTSTVIESSAVPPSTETERSLAALWASVLGQEGFGIHDNFFELGGHSLSITQVYARLNKTFGIRVPLGLLFEQPTIAQQAAAIDAARAAEAAGEEPAITPQPRPERLPLSFAQSRLWFLHQYDPTSLAYHVPNALRLPGVVDREALEAALAWLHARHEPLRTAFPEEDGTPWQNIAAPGPVPLAWDDLRGTSDMTERLAELAGTEAAAPFDLREGPVARYRLVQCEDEAILLMTLHHIATDGWSMDVLVRDLRQAYAAFAADAAPDAPPLPIQYADYTLWQRSTLAGERLDEEVAFWQAELDESQNQIALPYDHPRPPVQSVAGRLHVTRIPPETVDAVRRLGQSAGATEFMTWLALYNLLLQRWSGQEDFNVGTPVANRHLVETEDLVGFFVNTLVLRSRQPGTAGFKDLLQATRATAQRAFAHPDMPFELLVDRLNPERHPGYQPLFQVGFALQRAYEDTSLLDGDEWIARFDLQLILYLEADGSLRAHWEYAKALFEPDTIERLARSLQALAEQALAAPEKAIDAFELLTDEEYARRRAWNETARPVPALAVHQCVETWAAETPEALALIGNDGRCLDYGTLNARANALAHRLRAQGVGRESLVGVCLERSPELIVSLLAILKAGGAYVPLDPDYPVERLAELVADSGLQHAVTRAALASRLPAGLTLTRLDVDVVAIATQPVANLAPCSGPDQLAYLLYTSGSTGRPKGVAVEHRAVLRLTNGSFCRLDAEERVLQFAPVAFDASTLEIWGALCRGACLVQAPAGPVALDALAELLVRESVTTAWLTSALFNAMVDQYGESLRGLKQLLTGGDALSAPHARRALALLEAGVLINGYGPTETTTFATTRVITPEDLEGNAVPIGSPIDNTTCHVLNAAMMPQPVGVEGELYVGGAGLARGYLGQPDMTAERFVPDPFGESGERLYRTGDRVRHRADGSLVFLGRSDFQIKLRGYRIEPGEIEACLSRHPLVNEALVVVAGQGVDKRLAAYCLTSAEPSTLESVLRPYLAEHLPPFMVPAELIGLEAWPINASGKIDRRALPRPGQAQEADYVAPANDTETRLAAVWAELLQRDRVSVTADFFSLGGNSLNATQLLARVRQAFGHSVTIPLFFADPTVRAMARHLDAAANGETAASADAPVDGDAESRIDLPDYLPPLASSLENVLLTGATGYLGAYLVVNALRRWPDATLYCHVRARDEASAMARLVANLEQYGLWEPTFAPRLRVLVAALDEPRLGLNDAAWQSLARRIDLIIHNASQLNHVLPYHALRQANVEPTRHLLALAFEHKLKGFMYVSTTGVLHGDGKGRTVDEDVMIEDEPQVLSEGYNASKWVAELMVRRAVRHGLPGQIVRLGRVVLESREGHGRLDDFAGLFLRTCLRLNAYPDYPITEHIVPVDYLGEAVIALATDYASSGVHHLVGEAKLNWSSLLPAHTDVSRTGLQKIPVREWVDRIKQSSIDDPLPFAPYLFWWDTDASAPEEQRLKIRSQRTVRLLERQGIREPRIEPAAWTAFLERLFADEGRPFVPRSRRLF